DEPSRTESDMASIEKRQRNDRVRYYARYRDPSGRQVVKVFDRKIDAERHLITVENAKLTGSYVDPRRAAVAIKDWSRQWLAAQNHLRPSTRARYEGILKKQIIPRWGDVKLSAVSHAEVTAWINELSLAPATVR